MADFSTAAEVTVQLDQSSLRQARRELDDELGSVAVATDGGGLSGSARASGRQSARQRRRDRRTFRLDRERNDHLETIATVLVDAEQEGTLFGGGGGGGGGGGLGGGLGGGILSGVGLGQLLSRGGGLGGSVLSRLSGLGSQAPKAARLGGGVVTGATIGQIVGEALQGPVRDAGESLDFELGDAASGGLAAPFAAIADTGFAISDLTKETAAAPFELLSGGGVDFDPGPQFQTTQEAFARLDVGFGPDLGDAGGDPIPERFTRDLADRPQATALDALRPNSTRPPATGQADLAAAATADDPFEAQRRFQSGISASEDSSQRFPRVDELDQVAAQRGGDQTIEQQANVDVTVEVRGEDVAQRAADAVRDELDSVEQQFQRDLDDLDRDLRRDIRRLR